jgi:hypothetical protein
LANYIAVYKFREAFTADLVYYPFFTSGYTSGARIAGVIVIPAKRKAAAKLKKVKEGRRKSLV